MAARRAAAPPAAARAKAPPAPTTGSAAATGANSTKRAAPDQSTTIGLGSDGIFFGITPPHFHSSAARAWLRAPIEVAAHSVGEHSHRTLAVRVGVQLRAIRCPARETD